MTAGTETANSYDLVRTDLDKNKNEVDMLIPQFVKNSGTLLSLYTFNLETTRRADGRIEFNYKLVFGEKGKSSRRSASSRSDESSPSAPSKSRKTREMSAATRSSKTTDSTSISTVSKDGTTTSTTTTKSGSSGESVTSGTSTDSGSSMGQRVISMINVTLVLFHYAPKVLYDENQKIELPNSHKRKKARTSFNHEFKSTSTIREVLSEFFNEFKTRLGDDTTPDLSYSVGKGNNTKVISKKMMDMKIGAIAKDRENITIYVNGTKNELPGDK